MYIGTLSACKESKEKIKFFNPSSITSSKIEEV